MEENKKAAGIKSIKSSFNDGVLSNLMKKTPSVKEMFNWDDTDEETAPKAGRPVKGEKSYLNKSRGERT